jgi:16S rRNA processing protein RimM
MSARLRVGRIGAPHGVRGLVVVRSFTEVPEHLIVYGPLTTADSREMSLSIRGAKKAGLIVAIDGIDSREAAAALNGTDLFIARAALPGTGEDEFYHADLIGIEAVDLANRPVGRVVAVHDFGAGDLIELDPGSGATLLVPFTAECVPVVDIAQRRMVVDPPPADSR